MALSYLILGSNSAKKEKLLKSTIADLQLMLGDITSKSSVYESEAWGYESKQSYLNQVVAIETTYSPIETLHITQEIELKLGRTTKSVDGVYTDRPIDIDILFYDQRIVDLPQLSIPHLHITARRFVLEPLNEVAADYKHPKNGKTVSEMLTECTDKLWVKRL